jgi:hypothetical protein
VKGALGVGERVGKLGVLELRPSEAVLVEAGCVFNWIVPSQRSSLHGTVIKNEPIDIEEGFHGRYSLLRKGEGKVPRKNAGAVPEGTASRPAVETNGRDIVEK